MSLLQASRDARLRKCINTVLIFSKYYTVLYKMSGVKMSEEKEPYKRGSALEGPANFFPRASNMSTAMESIQNYAQTIKGIEDSVEKMNRLFGEYERFKTNVLRVVASMESFGRSNDALENANRLLEGLSDKLYNLNVAVDNCVSVSKDKLLAQGIKSSDLDSAFEKLEKSLRREQVELKSKFEKIDSLKQTTERTSILT